MDTTGGREKQGGKKGNYQAVRLWSNW